MGLGIFPPPPVPTGVFSALGGLINLPSDPMASRTILYLKDAADRAVKQMIMKEELRKRGAAVASGFEAAYNYLKEHKSGFEGSATWCDIYYWATYYSTDAPDAMKDEVKQWLVTELTQEAFDENKPGVDVYPPDYRLEQIVLDASTDVVVEGMEWTGFSSVVQEIKDELLDQYYTEQGWQYEDIGSDYDAYEQGHIQGGDVQYTVNGVIK